MQTAELETILKVLVANRVRFILIGGWAAVLHGSARATRDVNIVYARSRENLRALAAALHPYSPYLRGAPPGLPFSWSEATLRNGLNFTLTTNEGDLDLLGDVPGGGSYEQLLPQSVEIPAFGIRFHCVSLPTLIQLKRAAGRPKDLEAIAELEALRDCGEVDQG